MQKNPHTDFELEYMQQEKYASGTGTKKEILF